MANEESPIVNDRKRLASPIEDELLKLTSKDPKLFLENQTSNVKHEENDPNPLFQFIKSPKHELEYTKSEENPFKNEDVLRSEFDASPSPPVVNNTSLPKAIVAEEDTVVLEADDHVVMFLNFCLGMPTAGTCNLCPICKVDIIQRFKAKDFRHLSRHIYTAHPTEAEEMKNETLQLTTFVKRYYNSFFHCFSCPIVCSFFHIDIYTVKEHFKSRHKQDFEKIFQRLDLNHHQTFISSVAAQYMPKSKLLGSLQRVSCYTMVISPDAQCSICGYADPDISKSSITSHVVNNHMWSSAQTASLFNCFVHWTVEGYKCVYCLEKLDSVFDGSHHIMQKHQSAAVAVQSEMKKLIQYLVISCWNCRKTKLAVQKFYPAPWTCKYPVFTKNFHELSAHLQLVHMDSFRSMLSQLNLQGYLEILRLKGYIKKDIKPSPTINRLTLSLMMPSKPKAIAMPTNPQSTSTNSDVFYAGKKCVLCGFVTSDEKIRSHYTSHAGLFHMCFYWRNAAYRCIYCSAEDANETPRASHHMHNIHGSLAQRLLDESERLDSFLKQSRWNCEEQSGVNKGKGLLFPWTCQSSIASYALPSLKVHLLAVHQTEFINILTKLELEAHVDLLLARNKKLLMTDMDLGGSNVEHSYHNTNPKPRFPARKSVIDSRKQGPVKIVKKTNAPPKIVFYCPCKSMPMLATIADWTQHVRRDHPELWRMTSRMDHDTSRCVFKCPTKLCHFESVNSTMVRCHIYFNHLRAYL